MRVAAGYDHTVALESAGTVRAWGSNDVGQTDVPVDLGQVIQVAAGYNFTVALQANGAVRAWGLNDYGQTAVPSDLGVATQIAVGCVGYHGVAIAATAGELASHITGNTAALSDCEAATTVATTQGTTRGRGDVNDDGAVGQQDLQQLLRHWGPNSAAENTGDLKEISRSVKAALKEIKRSRRPG
jgi:alpha-tubulin suppressor-like RCC1 family protein